MEVKKRVETLKEDQKVEAKLLDLNKTDALLKVKTVSEKKKRPSVGALVEKIEQSIDTSYITPIANGDLDENDMMMKFRDVNYWVLFLSFSLCTIVVDRGLYFFMR